MDGGRRYQVRGRGRGGAGGKLPTLRLTRRSSTPYDRSQTGWHASAPVRAAIAEYRANTNNNNINRSRWLGRIVGSASRIITKGFYSLFRKRLPATNSYNADAETDDLEVQEDSLKEVAEVTEDGGENVMVPEMNDQQSYTTPDENQRNEPEVSGFEEILKDKTFSREEFNRLMKVLQTRVVDSPSGIEGYEGKMREELNGGKEPVNVANVEAQRWREERKKAREEEDNCLWDNTLFCNALSPSASQNDIGEGSQVSTPASRWTPIQYPLTGGREMLKRRSSVLDDGFTSVGPIRRTRQKSTFCPPFRKSDPSCSNSNQPTSMRLRGNDPGPNGLAAAFRKPMENEKRNNIPAAVQSQEPNKLSASHIYVPQKSSETAQKILEHLDGMLSPKEKSAEVQLAIARVKPPTLLSIVMLNGRARKSTETVDANHFLNIHASRSSSLQENNKSGKSTGTIDANHSLNMHASRSSSLQENNQSDAQGPSVSEQKHKDKGKSPLFNSLPACGEASTSHTGDVAHQSHDVSSSKVGNKLQVLDDAVIVLEKNKGFRMSALEESDDEGHVSKNATMEG